MISSARGILGQGQGLFDQPCEGHEYPNTIHMYTTEVVLIQINIFQLKMLKNSPKLIHVANLRHARAVDHAKFKTTKMYSQGILVDYSKFCTNENFPLYGIPQNGGRPMRLRDR